MKIGKKHFLLLTILLIYCGCSDKTETRQEIAYPVSLAAVKLENEAIIFLDVIGHIEAPEIVELRPNVKGVIIERYVEEGGMVEKGESLYLIDPRPYKAALDKAKATLAKDQATFEFTVQRLKRYEELVKQEYFSKLNYEQYKSEMDQAEAQIAIDRAEVDMAEINLEWTLLKAPLNGKLTKENFNVGNLIAENSQIPLNTIRQIDPIGVAFFLSQQDFVALQEEKQLGALKFIVYLPNQKEKEREGSVDFIDNQVNLNTGTILFKGLIPNKDEFFWPGEFVRVKVQLSVQKNALVIPYEALQIGQHESSVYVYHPDTSHVEFRTVVTGKKVSDNHIIIESGLKENEQVVTNGQINLRPDSKVSVTNKM